MLASAVHGVDKDIRDLADEFASHGYIAAAPDLFWRSVPGPLPPEDKRAAERSQPRLEKIKAGEADMVDTLAHIRSCHPTAPPRPWACYSGPHDPGPKRLATPPASLPRHQAPRFRQRTRRRHTAGLPIWATDRAAAEVLDTLSRGTGAHAERGCIFPGVHHGYMMRWNTKGVHAEPRVLDGAGAGDPRRLRGRTRGKSCVGRRNRGGAPGSACPAKARAVGCPTRDLRGAADLLWHRPVLARHAAVVLLARLSPTTNTCSAGTVNAGYCCRRPQVAGRPGSTPPCR